MNSLNSRRQRGLSLVELMIALLISSFLILGITQVYLDNKRSYVFQQNQLANLDNARFSTLMLDEVLGRAGYRRSPTQLMEDAFPAGNGLTKECADFASGAAVSKLKDSNATGFCIRFQPALEAELLCDGNSTALSNNNAFLKPQLSETVYLAVKFIAGDSLDEGLVQCISNRGTSTGALITGVADMQVEFGSGDAHERVLKKNSPYKTAASWSANDGMARTVRYAVLVVSRQGQRTGDSRVFSEWLAKHASAASSTRLAAQDQRHIYQVAVGGQAIRNLMP